MDHYFIYQPNKNKNKRFKKTNQLQTTIWVWCIYLQYQHSGDQVPGIIDLRPVCPEKLVVSHSWAMQRNSVQKNVIYLFLES